MVYRMMHGVVYRATVMYGPTVVNRAAMRVVDGMVYRVVRLRARGERGENGEQECQAKQSGYFHIVSF